MLQTTNVFIVNKSEFLDNINEIASGKVIVEANGKKSGMKFLIPKAMLGFAK